MQATSRLLTSDSHIIIYCIIIYSPYFPKNDNPLTPKHLRFVKGPNFYWEFGYHDLGGRWRCLSISLVPALLPQACQPTIHHPQKRMLLGMQAPGTKMIHFRTSSESGIIGINLVSDEILNSICQQNPHESHLRKLMAARVLHFCKFPQGRKKCSAHLSGPCHGADVARAYGGYGSKPLEVVSLF